MSRIEHFPADAVGDYGKHNGLWMLWERCKMSTTMNLLVVEDEAALRATLAQIFAGFGHRVRCAADGLAALSELRLGTPDIIVTDLHMPGMSGFELLPLVRRQFPAIKLVAMSSEFSAGEMPVGVLADAFYQKGGGLGSLLQIVDGMSAQKV